MSALGGNGNKIDSGLTTFGHLVKHQHSTISVHCSIKAAEKWGEGNTSHKVAYFLNTFCLRLLTRLHCPLGPNDTNRDW
jgi:hypothetical protein